MYNYKTNQSLCAFPWIHNYSGPRYVRKLCCTSDDVIGLDKTTEAEFMNSDIMKQIRLDMLAGKKIDVCHNCYHKEANGIENMRENSFRMGVTEEILQPIFENTRPDGTIFNKPSYYDNRTIHCNLQCVSCGPTFSSEHIKLFEKMSPGHIKKVKVKNPNGGIDRVGNHFTVDKKHEEIFALEMEEGLTEKRITNIYWAGGEPFMSPVHWRVMNKMLELREKPAYTDYIDRIRVHYNTNMTRSMWKGKRISEMLKPYKNLYIEGSIDGTHETFEYTRDGANWEEVKANWEEFRAAGLDMKITSVASGPFILGFDRYLDYFEQFPNIHIGFHQLMQNHHAGFEFNAESWNTLDPCFYPAEIIVPAIENAINRLKTSPVICRDHGIIDRNIGILEYYLKDKEENKERYSNKEHLIKAKSSCSYRDLFHKTRSLSETLKTSNPEASAWYESIAIKKSTNQLQLEKATRIQTHDI